jgi:hypothetical protein
MPLQKLGIRTLYSSVNFVMAGFGADACAVSPSRAAA